jgi:hypothetical protein
MTMIRRLLVLATLAAAFATIPGSPAHAEERRCRGSLGAVTVDNLRVPQGAICTLNRTRVLGTIKVERGAILRAANVRVIGNVQGENAAAVNVREGSRIGGSYQVVQGGRARLLDSRVNGDVLVDEDRRAIRIQRNQVGGNIQAFQNTGGVLIARNVVDGNLQCKSNRPAPTGGHNVVQGNKEDQCARL